MDLFFGFFKWVWSFWFKFIVDVGVEIFEFLLYSFFLGLFGKWVLVKVFLIEGFENLFGVLIKGFIDFFRNVVKVV